MAGNAARRGFLLVERGAVTTAAFDGAMTVEEREVRIAVVAEGFGLPFPFIVTAGAA